MFMKLQEGRPFRYTYLHQMAALGAVALLERSLKIIGPDLYFQGSSRVSLTQALRFPVQDSGRAGSGC
jgi:hypothetical protein